MTQKELLYVEDAIMHEISIISILEESLKNIQDDNLISFLEKEINSHKDIKETLITKLEEKTNE